MRTFPRCSLLLVSLVACHAAPPPAWLRYETVGSSPWVTDASGQLSATLHGARVVMDLVQRRTRIEVQVENPTAAAVEVRVGADGGSATPKIGQLLLRPIEPVPGTTVSPPAVDYEARKPVTVAPGWRATFFVHQPLGREPVLGQFFHWTVDVRDAAGAVQKRTVPLRAIDAASAGATGT